MEHIDNFLVMAYFSKYPTPVSEKPPMALVSLEYEGRQIIKDYTEEQQNEFAFNAYMSFVQHAAANGDVELIEGEEEHE